MPGDTAVYEQPLNERMRAFLRLEHLFNKADDLARGGDVWSSRAALDSIIDILALVGRMDLKTELIKELEHQLTSLEAVPSSPQVDTDRLSLVLQRLRRALESLRSAEGAFGAELKSNELINAVRQRNTIPAGTCDFDLPAYRFWLQHDPERRADDIQRWLGAFRLVQEAVHLSLTLTRSSAAPTRETAQNGFFQKTLDGNHSVVMVRVLVPVSLSCFTEISAGKHRFTVRFMEQPDAENRPSQSSESVNFRLACCGL